MVTKRIPLSSTEEAVSLFGELDSNINAIEKKYSVQIFIRHANGGGSHWPTIVIRGTAGKVDKAFGAVQSMREDLKNNKKAAPAYEQHVQAEQKETNAPDVLYVGVNGKAIRGRSPHQEEYIKAMMHDELVVAIGPAGTGKTFLAIAAGLAALKKGNVSRLVLTRPIVEVGEKLGYLPGDFYEKVNPYMKPMYDACYALLGAERFLTFRENETIEIVPIAYMRGRTLENAFIILDEAQNTTPEQMKMFLTRMGEDSQMVITGDITQIDLEKKKHSGLILIQEILKNIPGIRFCYFNEDDVVRHPLVKKIITAYDQWERRIQP
ncbi:MAG: AAA family ATPase [Elusimicrobia bacterium]|nr:AAA family ATPase [Elusimicrobiota bacterium]MBD3412094.1 AAA family ATPase [Elusimicrobiota bacterium]